MIARAADEARARAALARAPVVLLSGPRQVGKTTLARRLAAEQEVVTFFDLEDPSHAARLADPLFALRGLTGLVVLDEAQHAPGLFPVLRVLADRPGRPATFLVLGSASPDLLGLASESLAGRVELLELGGLRLADVGAPGLQRLWVRGGFPAAFLADDDASSAAWRRSFIATFLQRDLAALGVRTPAAEMRRF